jgi:putative tryptophan/tyrosine transport system substrate-binding protein
MRRREFIAVLGGAGIGWSLASRAQQRDRVRRIAVLMGLAEDDPEAKARVAAFRQGLETRGWSEGSNLQIEYRFARASSADQAQAVVQELIAEQPEAIFAFGTPLITALQRQTRTIPVVFAGVADPVGSGFIASLARPGGSITGVMQYEASVTGKWLAMLKEISPTIMRAAFVVNPQTAPYYKYYLRPAESLSQSLGIELVPTLVENAADIERAIESFTVGPKAGLIVPPDISNVARRDLIIALAARHRLPAVYNNRVFVDAGGLMSYGVNFVDMCRQAAPYVDRILRGDKPADLPVQAATKFETILNLKTANALGLNVPPSLLVAADEVIE